MDGCCDVFAQCQREKKYLLNPCSICTRNKLYRDNFKQKEPEREQNAIDKE